MDTQRLERLSKLSQDSNDVMKDLKDWIKVGERLKDRVSKIQGTLLEEYRDEVSRKS